MGITTNGLCNECVSEYIDVLHLKIFVKGCICSKKEKQLRWEERHTSVDQPNLTYLMEFFTFQSLMVVFESPLI